MCERHQHTARSHGWTAAIIAHSLFLFFSRTLSMSYGNWTPTAAASYFKLAWNCSSYGLARNALVCAKLTLTAQLNVTGVKDFNFMILIVAAG